MRILTYLATLFTLCQALAVNVPSDGSDGAFNPSGDILVDLSAAATGVWSDSNTANAGRGIYDPTKWAVVFKYSSVNIPAGSKVTFKNHPTYAPVIWLVAGNTVIDGVVSVAGHDYAKGEPERLIPAEPGPGGFRGGASGSPGFGIGYGPGAQIGLSWGEYALVYGNSRILPLIGGSGGTPMHSFGSQIFAGGGGGAILIASAGSVNIGGLIDANGGYGSHHRGMFSSGSGGAIRIIAEQVSGNGVLRAMNPSFDRSDAASTQSGAGRIRIESGALASTLQITPETLNINLIGAPVIFPPDNSPVVRVVSVGGAATPADPTAPLQTSADVVIETNSQVDVTLETTNFSPTGRVEVRAVEKYGGLTTVNAEFQSGNSDRATWIAKITFKPGYTTLQARATAP